MVYGKLNEHNKINENNEKTYNKLVRDKIPEIIKADGRQCDILIAAGDEKYKLLEAKLVEEVNEFLEDKNLEELADVMEVLFGLAESLGYSEEELLKARAKKLKERGGFKDGIVIKTVR
ncbi:MULTISPECIES: nucleoside triphosphate pyrophosphohydrolase [Clostridium]|uniref:nucleoside triphosphate pyrophosphohydrolase n=1 Tax=Clostridium TaxID=1485 RepID=UPI001494379A|nr:MULTISPECIES: nucleoside triphosphate pyrophosphohydrolase [Clostridium]